MIATGMTEHNCTTCKHTDTDQIGDRYCINNKSKHCFELVNENMVCELWESSL